jgi:hypothetical protein
MFGYILSISLILVLIGSLKSVNFIGRTITLGDISLFLVVTPLVILFFIRKNNIILNNYPYVAIGRSVFIRNKIARSWILLTMILMMEATLTGNLLNGIFLNQLRTLTSGLIIFLAARVLSKYKTITFYSLIILWCIYAYLLHILKLDFSSNYDSVVHLVGYDGGEFGISLDNLNNYGILWCLISSIGLALCCISRNIAVSIIFLLVPAIYVFESFSRSAYIIYGLLIISYIYLSNIDDRRYYKVIIQCICIAISLFIVKLFIEIDYNALSRLENKTSDFVNELILVRLGKLMIDPISNVLVHGSIIDVFFGGFSQPQHNSLTNYFVMYGFFGFFAYVYWIFSFYSRPKGVDIHLNYDIRRRYLGLIIFTIFFANDLATNLLVLYPPIAYLFYFLLGLIRGPFSSGLNKIY